MFSFLALIDRQTRDSTGPGRLAARSRTSQPLQERRKHSRESLLVIRARVDLSRRRELVHDLWHIFGQKLRRLGRIHSHLCCKRANLVRAEHGLNLAARNGQVFTHAYPG